MLIPAILEPHVSNIFDLQEKRFLSSLDKGIENLPASNVGNNLVNQKGFTSINNGFKPIALARAIDWFCIPLMPSPTTKQDILLEFKISSFYKAFNLIIILNYL